MELEYTCTQTIDSKTTRWSGQLRMIHCSTPYEMEVTARGSSFHIICGRHQYGNFICIPNWNIGTELASFSDCFWNMERLTTYYPELSQTDAASIVGALTKLNDYINL
jgi:hypothetical protein